MRIRARKEIRPDLQGIFSQFGEVEKVQLLEESKILEKGQFTMIGFILFVEAKAPRILADLGKLEFQDFVFILHRIKNKNEAEILPAYLRE